MRRSRTTPTATNPLFRCAVYTRKSTDEGLEKEFNSLDAQREAGEAYVKSLAGEGWTCLPDRYDDGGFTGGNMERPALQRLMADIEAGKLNVVVVYKVDRLSRSLLDFARMMETFDRHGVSFVSVTQQFNTATSMGRLVLNVLLSFAQFEREIISERTRDKIAATRRKGKWSGGRPPLGYDVDPPTQRLVVNMDESHRVQAIFDLYLEQGSLMPVVEELHRRQWTGKRWTNRRGGESGGTPFDRTALHRLLTNVLYTGHVRYKDEVHPGQHAAIVPVTTWQTVQEMLARNARVAGASVRNRSGAMLQGLLHCGPCNAMMTPSFSSRGPRRYRYYVCTRAQRNGWDTCPSKSIPAGQIEQFVVDQIRRIGRDPTLQKAIIAEANCEQHRRREELDSEHAAVTRDLTQAHAELQKLAKALKPAATESVLLERMAEAQQSIARREARLHEIEHERTLLRESAIDPVVATEALAGFDPVWENLTPHEQARIASLLLERVEYDGAAGKVSVQFRPTGLQTLINELPRTENP